MEVFRISSEKYAGVLTASGKSSRWNKDNQFVIYAGQSRSLATLENVVHLTVLPALAFKVMVISLPDDESQYKRIYTKDLPVNWRGQSNYSSMQDIGSDWYVKKESLILQVPSSIVPQEFNFIINTSHPDFKTAVKLVRNESYFWDKRLF